MRLSNAISRRLAWFGLIVVLGLGSACRQAQSATSKGPKLKPFIVRHLEDGRRDCLVCYFGAKPTAVLFLDQAPSEASEAALKGFESLLDRYAAQGLTGFVAFGHFDGSRLWAIDDEESSLKTLKARGISPAVNPAIIPARLTEKDEGYEPFDQLFQLKQAPILLFADARNQIRFEGQLGPELTDAVESALEASLQGR